MVGPDDKSKNSDGDHGEDHPPPAEDGFSGVGGEDGGDNPEGRKDENIYFWVTKESKKMLKENGISPSARQEEAGVEVTICQKHRNGRRQHRHREEEKEGGEENGPTK
jgi:hypothetical protein